MEEKHEVKAALTINGKEVWTIVIHLPKELAVTTMIEFSDKLETLQRKEADRIKSN